MINPTIDKMWQLADKVRLKAYAPYSNFKVGACLRTDKGDFFTGCNVENASYGLTICAETSAIAQLVSSGGAKITEVVIVADSEESCAPCGACRQRLFEFADEKAQVYFFNKKGDFEQQPLAALFPFPFSDKTLGDQ